MGKQHELEIEPLTEEAFRPFGEIIGRKSVEPSIETRGGSTKGWRVDFQPKGLTEVQYMWVDFQVWEVVEMERHFHVTQCFIPLNTKPMIMVVAPPTDTKERKAIPGAEDIKAFYMDGTQGIMLHFGTWHSPNRLAAHPPDCEFVILSTIESSNDLIDAERAGREPTLSQFVNYKERLGITFRPVWTDRFSITRRS